MSTATESESLACLRSHLKHSHEHPLKGSDMTYDPYIEYGLAVGCRVDHRREAGAPGTIRRIDCNLPDITTCDVEWDDCPGRTDVQWTNKIVRLV
jgi:hypothetical protein